jgi:glutathione S-transferase
MSKQAGLPVLYSFRRCPYAMRARMALACSQVNVELREVVLREMPAAMLAYSPKATVPVLVFPDDTVLEESRDIINWALSVNDPEDWMPAAGSEDYAAAKHLIDENDGVFKEQLDRYKYAERYPEHTVEYYREQGESFLKQLDDRLGRNTWLLGERMSVADVAIFPFVRQFAFVDKPWFDQLPWSHLQQWLDTLLQSDLFASVMQKYPQWQEGDAPTRFP